MFHIITVVSIVWNYHFQRKCVWSCLLVW